MRRCSPFLLAVGLILLTSAAPAWAELRFSRADFSGSSPVIEWNQKEMPGELETLDHLQRGALHYVGVEWQPRDSRELSEAYILVCDAAGRVLQSLPLDERFGGWQFVNLPGIAPRPAIVVNGGGGAHIYLYSAIYALGQDGRPAARLFETRAAWVEVEVGEGTLTITRSFDQMGGGGKIFTNVHRWDGQSFAFDAQQSTWPEESLDTRMVKSEKMGDSS